MSFYLKYFFLHVSCCSNKIHKPFGVVDVRAPQVFQAVQRAEDVTSEDYMIGQLLLSTTNANLECPSGTGMYQSGRPQFFTYLVLPTDFSSSEPDGRQTAGVTKNWAGGMALSHAALHGSRRFRPEFTIAAA